MAKQNDHEQSEIFIRQTLWKIIISLYIDFWSIMWPLSEISFTLVKVKFSVARSPQRKIYYHRVMGKLSNNCCNATEIAQWATPSCNRPQPARTIASELVDLIDWLLHPNIYKDVPLRVTLAMQMHCKSASGTSNTRGKLTAYMRPLRVEKNARINYNY